MPYLLATSPGCLWVPDLALTRQSGNGCANFRPTMLDDARWVVPFVDMMVAEKLPGVVSGATRAYAGWPPPEDYGALMEAFAKEGARPR